MSFINFTTKGQDVEITDGKILVNGQEMTAEEAREATGIDIRSSAEGPLHLGDGDQR
ncbi:hypothetical protein [Nocardiopsis halophila]|uniref:hypothetical protein n=1 Tax=Nocardiopsis halophila TaxID=141692 RepID=UPI00034B2208|nr:hypothetical protein [Nocardiopsis halophila]